MQLFQNKENKLSPLKEDPFIEEKDMQSLVEANMYTLFELEFISSEF